MPPEALHPRVKKIGNPLFYDLLRPFFVQHYANPLCSDALTGWCRTDPKAQEKVKIYLKKSKFLKLLQNSEISRKFTKFQFSFHFLAEMRRELKCYQRQNFCI